MRSFVVGVDLSLTSTGIAGADVDDVWVDRIRSKGRKDATVVDTVGRLASIVNYVLAAAQDADLAVVEAPSYGSHTGSQHERGGLWWNVVGGLVGMGIPVATVTPQGRAKYATGRGNAGKDEVLAAVVRRYPDIDVTGNDVADAVVLAAMGARWLGEPFDDVPKLNLTAMEGARWPSECPAPPSERHGEHRNPLGVRADVPAGGDGVKPLLVAAFEIVAERLDSEIADLQRQIDARREGTP